MNSNLSAGDVQTFGAGQGPAAKRRGPRTPDDRFAAWLRRLRWPVVLLWLITMVLLYPLSSGLSSVTNGSASANLPPSAQSTKVVNLQQAAAHGGSDDTAIVVFARSSGPLTPDDVAAVDNARTAVAALHGHVAGLGLPGPMSPSADGKAVLFSVGITSPTNAGNDQSGVKAIRVAVASAAHRAADTGLRSAVTGNAALDADSGGGGNTNAGLMLAALIIVAVILLLVYRSPVLWLLPLAGSIGAIVVAEASAHGLADAGLTVSSLSADILIVLVFGAASDYALLLVHRYRDELRHRAFPEAAMAIALRRTLPTLVASAATVTCAMLCLFAADTASLHGLGPVGAVGIIASLLAQTTFVPALLLVLGRASFWPRIPRHGAAGRDESRIWAGIGARVAKRPLATTLVMVALFGAACAGLASLRTDNNPVDNLKGTTGTLTGSQLLDAHYPAGLAQPLIMLAPSSKAAAAAAAARSVARVGSVTASGQVSGYARYTVVQSVLPYSSAGSASIAGLRSRLASSAPGSLVGGEPAVEYDVKQSMAHDEKVIIPLVLLVVLVVIALLLRAIVAPLVLVVTTGLSFAASLGLSGLLWRYAFGYRGTASFVPVFMFVFLVALGVDYNIFLSARIREESRSPGLQDGVLRALGVTGGVITAAGIVLAATFAALTQIPQVNVTQMGAGVALGVLLDTMIVRTVLVPASLLTIGERVWWPARRTNHESVTLPPVNPGVELRGVHPRVDDTPDPGA
jgi:putative drug exporter of the RND superfamily